QEEFFNTFNALDQAHKQIIITSDRPASEVSGLEKRLVSRFNAGLSVEMESPNSEMRLAILRYKLAHQNVTIPDEAERFIAENVKSNVRNLEGAMKRVLAYKNLNSGATLGGDELRVILRDLIDEDQRENVTAEGIRKAVCVFYNVNIDDLNRDSRVQTIVIPRQVAMFLCRVLLKDSSLPSIARVFDRTHANIYFACTKIKKLYRQP
ncbi:MAG: chromosomal replication initiator protein DnaA, partial [Paludibacteraceae bacterium]|nr:chromosomal replication initiator protein DnaA [Paludibacteraceae bacterium]